MRLEYKSEEPVYGENYDRGYIAFGYGSNHFASKGIAYFTRLSRLGDVKVSHALIVTGPDSCIEARYHGGVQEGSLKQYFDDEKYQLFLRKPRNLTSEIATSIIEKAATQLNCKYDTALLLSQAVNGSFLGKILDRTFGNSADLMLSALVNSKARWVCSELVAYAMDNHPEYHDKGILKDPHETIDPQELFEDTELFEPWHMEIVETLTSA